GGQPSPPSNPYTTFSPSMGVIIIVLVVTIFLMGFFSIYIRNCYGAGAPAGGFRQGFSVRARRTAAERGLNAAIVESFPTMSYSDVRDHKIGNGELECAVCLNEFADGDTLRLLPKCDHVFHPECIGTWLEHHVTCPVCRANLELLQQQGGGDDPPPPPPVQREFGGDGDSDDRIGSSRVDVAVQIEETPASETATRSWSLKKTGFGRFKSHSTGHSLVLPGENLERFTLRLPEGVRKEVIDRAMLNRTSGREGGAGSGGGSLRRVYRTGGRYIWRTEKNDTAAKSDRWAIFSRAVSGKLSKAAADGGGEGGSAAVKMPSFNCLEPKTEDGAGLIAN
ncbi:hypothetical protein M569_08482, partial [Genlisea aurea]